MSIRLNLGVGTNLLSGDLSGSLVTMSAHGDGFYFHVFQDHVDIVKNEIPDSSNCGKTAWLFSGT